jgi:serine/threonine protein kinase/WD40 repeat protein
MTTWNPQANDLFLKALDLPSGDERTLFLDEACAGDSALRAEVESLLEASERAGAFLESPATPPIPGPTVDLTANTACAGGMIDSYKLLEQIGEGGFGIVFMAEQQHPVRRKVALKVLKAGMDTRQVVARFEAERQALALMDHPNIAHVLDGGETASGRPYFVMELVRGVPITAFCDNNQLRVRERLKLFVSVCEAVQHAHQKGIIHRDLKPSNVMVTMHDEKPVVKVIDFGIAKAMGQQLTEKTLFTNFAQMVGTPLYMSPEQARMSGLDVDTRTDIYSLGVLLYELLTGTTPFDERRLRKAAFDEVCRIIREEEPARPSTRISTLGDAASMISTNRGIDPKHLCRLVRGELDWIVMKCLEKDRSRRYVTANSLAMDVERHLLDEPVLACPPSASYRLRKFARRHAIGLTMGAVCASIVLASACMVFWTMQQRTREQVRSANAVGSALGEAKQRLYRSLLDQARAIRRARRVGQRFDSLAVLSRAINLARELGLQEQDRLELRNEAIACLVLPDARIFREWEGWPPGSHSVGFDRALSRYARTDNEGNISVCAVKDGAEIFRLPGIGRNPQPPSFSPNGQFMAVVARDRLKIWDLSAQSANALLEASVVVDSSPDFSPDSRQLAIGLGRGGVAIYDLPEGRRSKLLIGGFPSVCVRFHPTERIVAASSRLTVQLFDVDSGMTVAELQRGATGIPWLDWSPNGATLAFTGERRAIVLWDFATHRRVGRLEGHKDLGVSMTFNHSGDMLASTAQDHMLRLWDARSALELLSMPVGSLNRCSFSPDDRLLAGESSGNRLRLWEVNRPCGYLTVVRDRLPSKTAFGACAISPDNRLLAVGTTDGVALFEVNSGDPLAFISEVGPQRSVVFERSGSLLSDGPAGVFRWRIRQDKTHAVASVIGPPQKLLLPGSGDALGASVGSTVLANAHNTGTLVWHSDSPDPPIRLDTHRDTRHVAVSPDGQWVATGNEFSANVNVFEARTGKHVRDLAVQPGSAVEFSPDGRWLATTGSGCRLWAVGTWGQGRYIGGDACAFSPDSRLLAVECGSAAVRLVDVNTGREYARLEDPYLDRARLLAFSPDGSQLVANGELTAIHIWNLREIRAEVAKLGLDWDVPLYPPLDPQRKQRLTVKIDTSNLDKGTLARRAFALGHTHWLHHNWEEAIFELSKVIEVGTDRPQPWYDRGTAHAMLGHLREAREDFAHAANAKPEDPMFWYALALANLGMNDVNEYRSACAEMRDRFGASPDPAVATTLALACTSIADHGGSTAFVVERARLALTKPGDGRILGQALYRDRQYLAAIAHYERWVKAAPLGLDDELFLAMSEHRVAHPDARKTFDTAVRRIDEMERSLEEGGFWNWTDQILVRRIRAEAAELFSMK